MPRDYLVDAALDALWLAWVLGPTLIALTVAVAWLGVALPLTHRIAAAHPRLGFYFASLVSHLAWAGSLLILFAFQDAFTGENALEDQLWDLRLLSDMSVVETATKGALLTFVFFGVSLGTGWLLSLLPEEGDQGEASAPLLQPRTFVERVVWVFVASPSAGFFEEILYRGIWLGIFMSMSNDAVIAAALSSLLFGLAHSEFGLRATIGTTALGLVAAISVLAWDSLWPAIMAHTIYDMTVYYLFTEVVFPDENPALAPSSSAHDFGHRWREVNRKVRDLLRDNAALRVGLASGPKASVLSGGFERARRFLRR